MRIYQFTIYTQLSKYINTLSLKVEWLRGYRRGNEESPFKIKKITLSGWLAVEHAIYA